jgi:hypothetical protein
MVTSENLQLAADVAAGRMVAAAGGQFVLTVACNGPPYGKTTISISLVEEFEDDTKTHLDRYVIEAETWRELLR